MYRNKFKLALASLSIAACVAVPIAYAAGLWPTFPIVAGSSFCSGSSTAGVPGTASTCNVTTPAGPTGVTGNEVVPADTLLSQGRAPQTVTIPTPLLASGSVYRTAFAAGSSFTVPNGVTNVILNNSGTIATGTVVMPSSPSHGQMLRLTSVGTVSALTLTGATGQTISNAPTAITISTTGSYGYAFVYFSTTATTGTWYRLL